MRLSDDLTPYLKAAVSPAVHPGSLALFRLLYCGALFFFMWDFDQEIPFFYQERFYHPVPTFTLLDIPVLPELGVRALHWVLLLCLALGGIGIGGRAPLLVAALSYFYLIGLQMGVTRPPFSPYTYHSKNLAFFILLILAASPAYALRNFTAAWREPLSRTCSGWPAQLVKSSLAIAYFGAAYCRLMTSTQWLDGYTLQAYLLERYLLNGDHLALVLARNIPLCIAMSWFIVLFELFFFVTVFVPRTALLFVPAGIAAHLGIWLAMDINFFPFFVTAYLSFVVDARQFWLARRGCGGPRVGAGMGRRSGLIFAGTTAILLACVFARVEYWPFTDFAVFSHPTRWSVLKVTRLGIRLPDESFKWTEKGDFCYLTPNRFYARYRRAKQVGARWYVNKLFDEASRDAHPARITRGSTLLVMQRQVQVKDSTIEVSDNPVAEIPVAEDRSLCL